MLCGLWNLDTTVRGWAWTCKAGGLLQDFGSPENSQPHVMWIDESTPKGLHLNIKIRPQPKARKLQCWMPHTIPSAKQGTTLHIIRQAAQNHTEPMDTPTHTSGHGTATQERQDPAPSTRTQAQDPQPWELHKALALPHPWRADSTIKSYDLTASRKETPNTVN